jgi:NTE family protein
MSTRPRTALVLAGAVAKGAFQAGAIEVLHQKGVRFARVVAASSGAINGAYWTAATRAGREDDAAKELATLWRDRAGLGIFHLSPGGILGERGLSTGDRIATLLEKAVGAWLPGAGHRAELRLVVAPLAGADGEIGGAPATTYQRVLKFDDADFDSRAGRDKIFRAATASGAFPGAFVPVELPGLGACVDGGTVNNTPVKEAIADGVVDRIVVVTPQPLITATPRPPDSGLALVGRIADILINERLFRDLRETESVNAQLDALDRLRTAGTLDEMQLEKVKSAVGLGKARPLTIVQVRPEKELAGNSFSGFFSKALREEYLDAGREAATAALSHFNPVDM